jgi:hypothetical protein
MKQELLKAKNISRMKMIFPPICSSFHRNREIQHAVGEASHYGQIAVGRVIAAKRSRMIFISSSNRSTVAASS